MRVLKMTDEEVYQDHPSTHPDISHFPSDQPIPEEDPEKIPIDEPGPFITPNKNPWIRVLNIE